MDSDTQTTESVTGAFLQRLGAQDAEGVAGLFADDIDWYVPGDARLPWAGTRTRAPQVAEYFNTMWPHFEAGKSIVRLNKLVVSGEDAVILADFSHQVAENGRVFQTPAAMHLVVRNGRIVRLQLFEDTLAVERAFYA